MTRALEILATGPLATLQDLGRVGHLALGVSPSGAADQGAYALGQRLLGNAAGPNPAGLPAIEATLGALVVRAHGDVLACLTGAPIPATVDGQVVAMDSLIPLRNRQVLTLGMPSAGLRTYLSVRGGLVAESTLGSCSTDTLSGLGPPPLAAGQMLEVGPEPSDLPHLDHAPFTSRGGVSTPRGDASTRVTLSVSSGPRVDWFEGGADLRGLLGAEWAVSDRSDRKGIRLIPTGSALRRRLQFEDRELLSEGMVPGAIQAPPGGELVILHRDHPVTGGYPVLAVVSSAQLDHVAQLVPGQQVRFSHVAG